MLVPCDSEAFGGHYEGRRVLVTGHTGFKGAWLCEWLLRLGARVTGFSLPAPTRPALFDQLRLGQRIARHHEGDIRDSLALRGAFEAARPDFVFHLAAQPLVRLSYEQPQETFAVNVMGTVNVMECLRRLPKPCTAVLVASDKCYENSDHDIRRFQEDDPLGGSDPYSASKGAMEVAVQSYRRSFFSGPDALVRIASARAGNCIGGGDWARDRIVPDCIRALRAGEVVPVRNPLATRPWQHALEPLGGYLWLGARLHAAHACPGPLAGAFNFGPDPAAHRTVGELVGEALRHWPGGTWGAAAPPRALPASRFLALNVDKAADVLGWRPVWDFRATVAETVGWYRRDSAQPDGHGCLAYTQAQIARYTAQARALGAPWAGEPILAAA